MSGAYRKPLTGTTAGFPERLKKAREARGLSHRDLERMLPGVVSDQHVANIESGGVPPSLIVAVALARAVGVPLADLVGADAFPPAEPMPVPKVKPRGRPRKPSANGQPQE